MSEILNAVVTVDGPLPRPPLFSLITVAQEAAGALTRGGAVITPYPAGKPDANDPCANDSARDKLTPEGITIPAGFAAFDAYLGDVCTATGVGDWSDFKSRANLALAAREAWALERQLVAAQFASAPHLQDADVDVLTGSAVAARTAVAFLEGAIAETAQGGVLHLSPEVVTYLGFESLRVDGTILRTAAGTPVISGTGYSGGSMAAGGPGFPTGQAAAGVGQSWCYATGPILYARGTTIFNLPDTIAEALDRGDNTVVYRAERDLWVGWDKQLQAAVLADWSP